MKIITPKNTDTKYKYWEILNKTAINIPPNILNNMCPKISLHID